MYEKLCRQKSALGDSQEKYWNNREHVAQFVQYHKNEIAARVKWQLESLSIPAGSSVLDIGAGPGTLAVPLAKAGCEVTALEPSAPMLEELEKYRAEEGAPVIATINQRFEDAVDVGRYDYLISSFAFMFGSVKSIIEKMNAAANREVHIFWFISSPAKGRGNEDLWPLIHGEPYASTPTSDILFGVLMQMGIRANMSPFSHKTDQAFATFNDVYTDFERRMLASTEEHSRIIRKYVEERVVQTHDGFIMPSTAESAHLWWKI